MHNIIEEYYDHDVATEWSRMDRHPLEFEISKRHIEAHLGTKAKIADIGGGPGRYSLYFAGQGHDLTLIDLSSKNVEHARKMAKDRGLALSRAEKGSALELSALEADSYDTVLCMGPLYHLQKETDRIKAIEECLQILKPEGILVIAFLTKMAQAITILERNPESLVAYEEVLKESISTGHIRHDSPIPFTEAFTIEPKDIKAFMGRFGLRMELLAGAEGIACSHEGTISRLGEEHLKRWIDFSFRYSTDESMLGMNKHILYIGRKEPR
ncbi:MAG TPA: class I SAM-dependent methyltransferase [Rectinemataceae bacterium]|nr:class I SAM-dependent methyltransferase [Rectinemataceae bacterium]